MQPDATIALRTGDGLWTAVGCLHPASVRFSHLVFYFFEIRRYIYTFAQLKVTALFRTSGVMCSGAQASLGGWAREAMVLPLKTFDYDREMKILLVITIKKIIQQS